jgi:hypothetical protein
MIGQNLLDLVILTKIGAPHTSPRRQKRGLSPSLYHSFIDGLPVCEKAHLPIG